MQKHVYKINPEFVKIDKEPIDISYSKGSQYLVGCFDGTIQLIDKMKPENNKTFDKHLKNRSTWIRSIIIDCDGKIWVGTSNGLTVYNRDYRIIMEQSPYDDKVKFFGHFRILWASKNGRYIYWWCDRGSLKVFDARTLKQLFKCKDFLKHPDERPNHYTFLDGNAKKLFVVTNHQTNAGVYYVIDFVKRKVFGGDRILPKNDNSMLFAHVCVAYNSPSDCIVTTGVGSYIAGDVKRMESKEEISHVSVYKLNAKENVVSLVDCMLNSELKLMTIAAVVFHTPNHSRILSVLTKHIYIMDLINGKLSVLFRVRDINRGECVHQMARLGRNFLFVGNLGQIFRIEFKKEFYYPEGAEIPADDEFEKSHPGLVDGSNEDQCQVVRTGGKRFMNALTDGPSQPPLPTQGWTSEGIDLMKAVDPSKLAQRSNQFGPVSLRNPPSNMDHVKQQLGSQNQEHMNQFDSSKPQKAELSAQAQQDNSKSPGISQGAGVIGKGMKQVTKGFGNQQKSVASPHIHPILGVPPISQGNHSRSPPFANKEGLNVQSSAGVFHPQPPHMSFQSLNQAQFNNHGTLEYLQSHGGGRGGMEYQQFGMVGDQGNFQRKHPGVAGSYNTGQATQGNYPQGQSSPQPSSSATGKPKQQVGQAKHS